MENAGRGSAELLCSLGTHGRVVICCGKGNNGGDGYVIARHLDIWQVPVSVLLFARPEELTGDAAVNYGIIAKAGLPIEVYADVAVNLDGLPDKLARADWVVDALFGTGLQGSVRAPFDKIIAAINASPARVLAVDIPSGLDSDTGQPLGPTVQAHHTATFVALKKGFGNPKAKEWTGQVHVVDIGVPNKLLREFRLGGQQAQEQEGLYLV
jgi:NAD(P)H-hydrate epimerase